MVKLNNKSTRYICERPYDTVLDFISRYPLAGKGAPGETVVTYKEQIINVEERICNLEETSVEYPLFIYLKFGKHKVSNWYVSNSFFLQK